MGHLGGPRSSDCPNARGSQWAELIDHHSLYVPTLSNIAVGPAHTYHRGYSGNVSATVDYALGNLSTSTILTSFCILEDHHLRSRSNHLKLNLEALVLSSNFSNCTPPLDWDHARADGSILSYALQCNDFMQPLLNKDYSSLHDSEIDLSHVSKSLIPTAASTIPHFRPSNHGARRHIKDAFLSTLCWRSWEAFRLWKVNDRDLCLRRERSANGMCLCTCRNAEPV